MKSNLKQKESNKLRRAIENGFPFEDISLIAQQESYRKELYRPIYYIHKWWARRLGSVFRSLIIGSAVEQSENVLKRFYKANSFSDIKIFDPFMGSGTTVGEAYKLGCTALGKDINPISYRAVRTALGELDYEKTQQHYNTIKSNVGKELKSLYKGYDSKGNVADVLYYFWVKVIDCPKCQKEVELFSSYVFAKHAYPSKHPKVQVYCPDCKSIFESHYKKKDVECPKCSQKFNQKKGPAKRTNAQCNHCNNNFSMARTYRKTGTSPKHKLYAKLVLRKDGTKEYLKATEDDIERYEKAGQKLKDKNYKLPKFKINEGYNTNQVLNYGYKYWSDFFNKRQLYGLITLAKEIERLPEGNEKDLIICLFSGLLEFNNMFASYKGEGTGAVRHMFSHHILKPERTPLEANIWGTPKSSGSFSGLFKLRVLRLLKYRNDPFEVRPKTSEKASSKIKGINKKFDAQIKPIKKGADFSNDSIYLACGDSSNVDLFDKTIDFVITDPPFFDNVHYSELADFFYSWQETYFYGNNNKSTRRKEEVQDADKNKFANKLESVFLESKRILKDNGLLIFSYHHSKESGWTSIAKAVIGSGFTILQAHPIKSEMSQSTTKKNNPIDIDVILICSKQERDYREERSLKEVQLIGLETSRLKIQRFNNKGKMLSGNDIKVILFSNYLVEISPRRDLKSINEEFKILIQNTGDLIDKLYHEQVIKNATEDNGGQVVLF